MLRRGELRVYLDVFNAYDQRNLLGHEPALASIDSRVVVTQTPVKMFPVLPNLGASYRF